MDNEIDIKDPKLIEILDKTGELFFEFGIRNLNMDDISRNLKISKKTLYHFFKSKEDLIEKLFYYNVQKWDAKISELKTRNLNAIDILIQVSIMVSEEVEKLNPKLKFELKKYYEPIFHEFTILKQNHIYEQIGRNIKKGISEGLYREDVNIDLVAGLYVRNLIDMHNKDYCFSESISFDTIFKTMFENHIRAISTPEGIAYFEKRKSEIDQQNKNINNQ